MRTKRLFMGSTIVMGNERENGPHERMELSLSVPLDSLDLFPFSLSSGEEGGTAVSIEGPGEDADYRALPRVVLFL